MATVVVTGSTGAIGSATIAVLEKRRAQVVPLSRASVDLSSMASVRGAASQALGRARQRVSSRPGAVRADARGVPPGPVHVAPDLEEPGAGRAGPGRRSPLPGLRGHNRLVLQRHPPNRPTKTNHGCRPTKRAVETKRRTSRIGRRRVLT